MYSKCAQVVCIGQLNSLANRDGKGRNDLDVSILEAAIAILPLGMCPLGKPKFTGALSLANDVVESFEAMRSYLRELRKVGLHRVDPELSRNRGLVQRLVKWEETWEVGLKFVKDKVMRAALHSVHGEIRKVQNVEPNFRQMLEDNDVGLFLSLPRVIILHFLNDPKSSAFVRDLLPHRFPADTLRSSCEQLQVDADLKTFQDRYYKVCKELLKTYA